MLTFANLPSFLWAEAIATACFIQNRSIIYKCFDKAPYELINKRKPNIKFFHVFGCRCYLLNNYEDVGKLKAKGDIGVFVGYSKESDAFKIYNKRTRKIHESVNLNLDEISEMASKQFSLEPGLSKLNEMGKSSNRSVLKVDEASKNDLEDLFQDFYDEYFDSSKIMKSSTTNVETSNAEISLHGEEVFHESIPINMVPNGDEASTSHNVFNERLKDAYFDASTLLQDPSIVHTYYQPYPHEKKWTKDHPLHKIIGDPKSSVRTRVIDIFAHDMWNRSRCKNGGIDLVTGDGGADLVQGDVPLHRFFFTRTYRIKSRRGMLLLSQVCFIGLFRLRSSIFADKSDKEFLFRLIKRDCKEISNIFSQGNIVPNSRETPYWREIVSLTVLVKLASFTLKKAQEKDKIRSKQDKNGKRGKAGKSQKQLQ
nr:hypothetical protein [Tanacetum cinerariifolium]